MSLKVEQSASQLLHEAFVSLRTLGKRSILALLGIVIGSSSVVALINIGHNAAEDAAAIFQNMGTDTLVARFPASADSRTPLPAALDTRALSQAVPSLVNIAPTVLLSATLIRNGRSANASVVGATAELAPAMRLQLREGRFLSDFDQNEIYAVIGYQVAQTLGAAGAPLQLGDRVRINDYLFLVIGILQNQPSAVLVPIQANDSVFLPQGSMRRIFPSPQIDNVVTRVAGGQNMEQVAAAMTQALKKILRGREVEVQVPQQIIDGMTRQSRTFGYLLMALGGISLVGGGVGVMNVMLMNVSERRREIGIRMALGARQKDIRNLFLLEAVSLTAVGALSGAILGVASAFIYARMSGWHFSLAGAALPLGIGSTLLVGLFFGLYPAISASRLQPVEALRDE
ncbi:putative ABC transport system permease protein [Pseudomonas sp. NFPP10]|uniref:ABC transporter permease n=1 Tax=unclassified Pseudomonas TaxID=196821 RepID=UPI00088A99CA|nr:MULTISPECIES: ABC transporter permease [unclassified Pseudomonas]SDA13074.1 putative ABC transport system permease protein [Pseudomonas sp. NFPP12]SEK33060.1 putative ABC transport system permease protein [Pseudomonas sp. NFPP10]SFI04707.1 putative ABC transport system permease protein [Pseudomonas sp. NFPP08]SFM21065.1 putative ABC transport system permease protein [Pseudomonas sp. NFPP05]SFX11432.1 putative ABC transport system permease protein [Pseudomonas sp. NFPP09]